MCVLSLLSAAPLGLPGRNLGRRSASLNVGRPARLPAPPNWAREPNEILSECPGSLGFFLWRAAEDARLWASAPEGVRPFLFHRKPLTARTCTVPPDAAEIEPLILRLLGLSHFPELAQPADVAAACRTLSDWAESSGRIETALHFAETAALTDPQQPEYAARAGFLSYRLADHNRAAAWYWRTIAIARQGLRFRTEANPAARKWRATCLEWYIRGHLRLGILYFQMGRHDLARPHYRRAARKAAQRKRTTLAAQANHDLLTLESDVGTYARGEFYASRALELYPVRHPRVAHLAHDYAYLLVRNSMYSRALFLLSHLGPDLFESQYRVIYWGTVARAAAGIGDRSRFELAAEHVKELASESDEYAAISWVHLAEGERIFGEWDGAERYAATAVEVGLRRRDGTPVRMAHALLDEISARVVVRARDAAPPAQSRVAELIRAFIRRLGRQAAPQGLPGAALGVDTAGNLGYFAGSGQGTITKPPEPIEPPLKLSS